MECAVDAQSLISISLMKIHKSRTQRGGIKLHRNLLVSCVLRNARQVYIREKYAEIYRMQQYEEVRTVCDGIRELDPEDPDLEDLSPEEEAPPGCAPLQDPESPFYRSCCMEPPGSPCDPFPGSGVRCSQTTVLDLDTHVVTTVEDGFLHQDCCCAAPQCAPPDPDSPVRKRKGDFGGRASDPEEVSDFIASRKRVKREPNPEPDASNISNLISIFGSGFSGLLSRQADLDQVCSKQTLAGLGAWTRAIVAF